MVSAVNAALLLGMLASVAGGTLVAVLVTRRLLRPLNAVRAAARSIAAGHYDTVVPLPGEVELAALATDVNVLAGTLADTERRRTRMLGDVAHEMRTPLTALDGYVEGMIDGVFPATPETLAPMADELRRLHRLSEDLGTLSRAEERRLELRPVPVDLADLASRAAERLRPQFEDAGVALTYRAGGPVPVVADPDRITQVLTNLLGNALLATSGRGPGGSPPAVDVTVDGTPGRAGVTVTDNGVGLAAADLERVFERFYRAGTGTRRSGGSGVGLTIARSLARAHGGDLTAASPGPGRGATFVLTLPS